MTKPDRPPIIIIGMHRSGTSMVTRALEQLGLFTGWRKERNNEALFFQNLNRWIMAQCGGAWDYPLPCQGLVNDSEIRTLTVDYLNRMLRSFRTVDYLGPTKYLYYRSPCNLDIPWGWKDPRNTFTLPVWFDIFPDAKVIHVYRHGVDVAQSLQARRQHAVQRARHRLQLSRPLLPFRPMRGRLAESIRTRTLEGGFTLWEEYMAEAQSLTAKLGKRAMEIQFEGVLEAPSPRIERLAEFCGLTPMAEQVSLVTKRLRRGRAWAYREDTSLREQADNWAHRLSTYGY